MATLYDNFKRANSSYVPQFIGSEKDELKSVGDVLDNRYRTNQANLDDALINVANEEYAPGDEHIGEGIYGKLAKLREDISSSDGNFENSTNLIRNEVRKHVSTNPARIQALRNSKKYREYEDLKTHLGPEAVDFTPRWQGTLNEDGTLNRFQHQLEKRLDYNAPKEKLFNDISPDLIPILSKYNPATGQIEGGATESNKQKIKDYLGQAFARYKGDASSEYNQEKKVLLQKGIPVDKVDQYILKSITDVGQERVMNREHKTGENASHTFLSGLFPSQAPSFSAGSSPGEVHTNDVHKPIATEATDKTIEKEGNNYYQWVDKASGIAVDKDKNPLNSTFTDEGTGKEQEEFLKTHTKVPVDNKKALGELTAQYNKINSNVGDIYGGNFDAYKAAAQQAAKNAGNVTASGSEIAPDQADTYNKEINSNGSLTVFTGKNPTSLEAFAKEIGTSPSNIKFKASKVFHESAIKGLPGGYIEAKVEVNDSKVKSHPTTVKIPLNRQGQAVSRNIDDVYKNSIYQGSDTYTIEHPYIVKDIHGAPLESKNNNQMAIWTTTYPKPIEQQVEGEIPYETVVHKGIKDKNGNITHTEDLPLAVYKEYMEGLMRNRIEGTLNSGQTFNAKDINPKTKQPQEEED